MLTTEIKLLKMRRAYRSLSIIKGLLLSFLLFLIIGEISTQSYFGLRFWTMLFTGVLFYILSLRFSIIFIVLCILISSFFLFLASITIPKLSEGPDAGNTMTIALSYPISFFLLVHFVSCITLNKKERHSLRDFERQKLEDLLKLRLKSLLFWKKVGSQLLSILSQTSRGVGNYLSAVLFGILTFHVAIFITFLFNAQSDLWNKEYTTQELMFIGKVFLLVLILFSIIYFSFRASLFLISKSRKGKRFTYEQTVGNDKRLPILFLRSFHDDQVTLPKVPFFRKYWEGIPEPQRLDHQLIENFNGFGPLIAIGKPGEKELPYGAARMYVEDKNWKETVVELAEKSLAIVVVVDSTVGLKWEIEKMLESNFLEKTLFLANPNSGNVDFRQNPKLQPIVQNYDYKVILGIYQHNGSWRCLSTPKITPDDFLIGCQSFFFEKFHQSIKG